MHKILGRYGELVVLGLSFTPSELREVFYCRSLLVRAPIQRVRNLKVSEQ